ncbi:MAG: YifB family Mg chelatase-like AAA ATPase [Spirochaetota bacterium]
MLSQAKSLVIHGIDAHLIDVEVDIVKGLPNFTIVGLPDSIIRESKDRIRSAIENSGFEFPPKNFIVNLAPAGYRKEGANLDLPIAISILIATGQVESARVDIPMVGELSLDGRVRPVKGVISMAIALYRAGFRECIVPYENRNEATAIEGIKVYPVKNIADAIEASCGRMEAYTTHVSENGFSNGYLDMASVMGQESAKRALEIAAAGRHNILMYGPPGSGKTMLAKCVPGILPPLSKEQAITTTMIHSVGGVLGHGQGLIYTPPFRAPHHTSSDAALVGGGKIPNVGEVSLAHNGVLFLDEFVEFRNDVIQALRQPLEDCHITISRAMGTMTFPADFMLVASSNPCQCGYLFDPEIPCKCSPGKIRNYFSKIAGPILDRIDIEVLVGRVPYKDLLGKGNAESSEAVRQRVIKAREIQTQRFKGRTTNCNGRMTSDEVKEFCAINAECESILELAIKRMNLSARSFFRILKVSRTIADLDNSDSIEKRHILEALSYKNLQRYYDI